MSIRLFCKESLPRERYKSEGVRALSNEELISLVLGRGTKNNSVIDVSKRLMKEGLFSLANKSVSELVKIKGIGEISAMKLLACFELGLRLKKPKNLHVVRNFKDVYTYCAPRMKLLSKEEFVILHLNTKNAITKEEVVTRGILDASIVHPREVFKSAIRESASSIILVHNHPSGDPTPSKQDISITKRLVTCGDLLNIPVLDHVIIGDYAYSFCENKKLS